MSADYVITRIDEQIYTKMYALHGPGLHGHKVNVYAECSINHDHKGEDDFFLLNLFFDVDGYGAREHLIGLSFGQQGMEQSAIDSAVLSWIKDQTTTETFLEDIHRYIQKEKLFESWQDEQMRDVAE